MRQLRIGVVGFAAGIGWLFAAPVGALAAEWVRGEEPKDAAAQGEAMADAVWRAVRADAQAATPIPRRKSR